MSQQQDNNDINQQQDNNEEIDQQELNEAIRELDRQVEDLLKKKKELLKQRNKSQVTPWDAYSEGGIDYNLLVNQFGTTLIDDELIARFEKLTGKPAHPWLKRQIFFSHRDLDKILTAYEKGEKFYLYTGRGPSSDSLHLGHLVPFIFTKYLQDAFDVPLVIQLTDDEKYYWKNLGFEKARELARQNIKDIIAVGFNPEKTFIFIDTEFIGTLYPNIVKTRRAITGSHAQATFGFELTDNIGKWSFPAIQAVPSFSNSFPQLFGENSKMRCLIPCAIDQDPYFRLTRRIAPKLKYHKPAVIHSTFLPSLAGAESKMSSTEGGGSAAPPIFLTDSVKQIKRKINKYAFSGGKESVELHRQFGGDCDIDMSYQYLKYFEMDDEKLEEVRVKYSSGEMLSGEIKAVLIEKIKEIVQQHKENKEKVTEEVLAQYMTPRSMD